MLESLRGGQSFIFGLLTGGILSALFSRIESVPVLSAVVAVIGTLLGAVVQQAISDESERKRHRRDAGVALASDLLAAMLHYDEQADYLHGSVANDQPTLLEEFVPEIRAESRSNRLVYARVLIHLPSLKLKYSEAVDAMNGLSDAAFEYHKLGRTDDVEKRRVSELYNSYLDKRKELVELVITIVS